MAEEWEFPVITDFFETLANVFLASVLFSIALVLLLITIGVVIVIIIIWKRSKKKSTTKAKLRKPLPKTRGGRKW